MNAEQILVQLNAQGLIRRYHAKSTAGILAEWVQRTELGDQVMTEAIVVKS